MSRFSLKTQFFGLLLWLGLCFIAAGIGAVASVDAGDFYQSLNSPSWAPPARLFGPVWSILYLMMGIAAWIAWREQGFMRARTALTLFCIQLAANALWTWLFFHFHLGLLATVDIGLLVLCVVATMFAFWRIRRLAAVLMLPYLAWVIFASALCVTMWRLNPATLG